MINLQEVRQERSGLVVQARAILDKADTEKRELSTEEQTNWDKIMSDVEKKGVIIAREEKQQSLERSLEKSQTEPNKEPLTLSDGTPNPRATEEYGKSFRGYIRGGLQTLKAEELRAMQADDPTLGGYMQAPQQFVAGLIKAVDDATIIRPLATVYPIEKAESLGACSLDTDVSDPEWTGEITTAPEDSSARVGKRELRPHPLSKLVKVSNKLLRVSVVAPDTLVQQRLAYKFGIVQEKAHLVGTGAGQPLGVFTASSDGISTGRDVSTGNEDDDIRVDGLLEAKFSVKAQYWPKAVWIFHRDAVKRIAKLKDGEGRYIWNPAGIQNMQFDTLLNRPVKMSEYAPNTFTTGLYVGIFGDFSFYWIADAMNLTVQRLVELYAATNQVGFIGRLESDGQPVLEEAFARVKLA